MDERTFALGLRTLAAQLPYGKRLEPDELTFLWMILPTKVTAAVTDQMWAYAIQQRLIDPKPNNDIAIVMQPMKYLFRCRDGMPAFELGLREDLGHRMQQADHFHTIEPCRPEAAPPPEALQLPPPPPMRPETKEERQARLLALAAATGVDLSQPLPPLEEDDGNPG